MTETRPSPGNPAPPPPSLMGRALPAPETSAWGFSWSAPDHSLQYRMHARYYGGNMGRFTKPDNILGSLGNPQSWNLYAYVLGNPVKFNDPTGHVVNLGSSEDEAKKKLEALKKSAGSGGNNLTMEKKEHKFLFFKWTTYELGTNNAKALGQSGNVGKALNEWMGSKLTLNISLGKDSKTVFGGGAYTELNKGEGATIHLDPQAVEGATIGGVKQTEGSAMTHEIGHSLYALHPELEAASAADKYGHVDPMGYHLARDTQAKTEGFPIAFENSTRPADQQRPYWIQEGDYDPPAAMPSPLW